MRLTQASDKYQAPFCRYLGKAKQAYNLRIEVCRPLDGPVANLICSCFWSSPLSFWSGRQRLLPKHYVTNRVTLPPTTNLSRMSTLTWGSRSSSLPMDLSNSQIQAPLVDGDADEINDTRCSRPAAPDN